MQGFVVDRIQSGGPSTFNVPSEQIRELGNWNSVATVYDTPELTFDLESYDVSTECEALLTGMEQATFGAGLAGTEQFDFQSALPLDVISPWKGTRNEFDIDAGLLIPYLTLQSASYRFGVGQNSSQSFQLSGDAYYFVPGAPKWERITLTAATTNYPLADPAILYTGNGVDQYVVSAKVINPTTGLAKRLFFEQGAASGDAFDAPTNAAIDVGTSWLEEGYTYLDVMYGTTAATQYLATVHEGTGVKPAAVRGKDVRVRFSLDDGASFETWRYIQNFEITWQANSEQINELGNEQAVETSNDTPTVSGSLTMRPTGVNELYAAMRRTTGTADGEIVGPDNTTPLMLSAEILHPDTGVVLKTLETPDARITLPPISGQVQQNLDVTMSFTSDTGEFTVYEGDRT